MLKDPNALLEFVDAALARAGKSEPLSWDDLRGLLEALLEPFGVQLGAPRRRKSPRRPRF